MCCVGTAKAEEVTIDGIKYDVITKAKQATVISGGTKYSGDIVIPSEITYNNVTYSVTSIGEKAFYQCYVLTSVTIGNSVTSIGEEAFAECYGLTSITIPNSVTSIEENAFAECYGLTSVTIGNSVTSIGDYAFFSCDGLTSVTIGNSVTSIGYDAFEGCDGLKEVHINDLAAWCSINFDNSYSNPLYYAQNLYLNNELITELVIPNGVTSIKNNAFVYCSGLTSVTIPNSVKSIGRNAFQYCSGLTSITIPNSVTSIGKQAFYKCSGLTSITIPNSVTSIGSYAFQYCSGLTSVTIGNSVTSIESYAFCDCDGLKEVHINDLAAWCSINFYGSYANPLYYAQNLYLNNELITELVIPNGVTSIGDRAFWGCSGLTSITIPNSVTSIGDQAFDGCSGLKEVHINDIAAWCNIDFENGSDNPLFYAHNLYLNNELVTELVIPDGVTSIGDYAFLSCSGLTSITISNSVTSIGYYAFWGCSNLTDVYCLATNVPTTESDAFSGSYPEYMTLHVPAEAINSYKTTWPWSSFGNVVAIIIEKPKCAAPVIEYYNGELIIECQTENAEFATTITNDYTGNYNSNANAIALTATYNISVYATATGYDNSDTVNATLCWIECDCNADDNTSDVINVPAKAVLVTSNNGTINISCLLEGEVVELYTSDAMYIGSTTIENSTATIESGLSKGDIAIVKIAEKSIKVILN